MKRLTSLFLVLAMLLTFAPMNIFAADADKTVFSDMKDTDYYATAATALEQLDILAGYPDGTFGAEKSITRAEMAAVVCRMIDKETAAEDAKGATIFDDVTNDHWATGYINIASKEGIINGDGNGKFRPEDDVKYEEAIKMVVCALGYGKGIIVDAADWSKGYLEVATQKGISDGLKGGKGKAATRGDIAVMSYNGLATETATSKIPAAPVASKKAGEFLATQKVKLTTTTKDADIYYTTDGTTPTVKSTKYVKEISISKTTTLKAIAVKNGVASKVMSVEYTFAKFSGGGGGGGGGGSSSGGSTTTEYTVSFDLNYEGATGAPAAQTVEEGETATKPADPEREGYAFVGWYVDNTYTELFNFTTAVTKAYTLVARWIDTQDTTDTDADGLTDPIEEYYGTNKDAKDSDGDELTDFFEVKLSNTNPLAKDSDDNGTSDADEDFDEDGFTNLQEQVNNCNPNSNDTDMDGLTDYDEINVYGTKPDVEDTDEDGLADGDEIALGLEPLVQKTDGTTLDSKRTFSQTLSEENISDELLSADNDAVPSLSMNVAGNVDSNTSISAADDTALTTNKAVVGMPVSVSTTSDTSTGEATISFDIGSSSSAGGSGGGRIAPSIMTSSIEDASQYLICKYAEDEESTEFEPLETTYSDGVLSASIDGEGTYFVLDTEVFLTNLGIYPLDYFDSPTPMMSMNMEEELVEEPSIPTLSVKDASNYSNDKPASFVMPTMLTSMEELEEELMLMSASTEGTKAQADVVFIIDKTGSMHSAISNVVSNVNKFADDLVNKYKINANFSLIEFQDITHDGYGSTIQHKNGASNWWNARSVNAFKNEVNMLQPDDGGDGPETDVDGLAMARELVQSSSTQKFFVLITDAPYKEVNQYGIKNMRAMVDLLVEDDINVSVITQNWDDYDCIGWCFNEDGNKTDVYYDFNNDKYFYYTYSSGDGVKTYIDKSDIQFELYVGHTKYGGNTVYYDFDASQYFHYTETYNEELASYETKKEYITDASLVYDYEGFVSGYKYLYEQTGGVFGYIGSSFSNTLNAIAGMINEDVNDGSWIILDNFETIKLDKAPTPDSDADSDGDDVLDIDELTVSRNTNLKEYITAYLSTFGLSYERYLELGGTPYVTVWSFKSRPDDADTDDDGFSDKEDLQPKKWDVTYRDLSILANTVYSNLAGGTILSSANVKLTTGSGTAGSSGELKDWRILESVYNPLTGFEAAAYAKDNNIIIATRGSESHDLADVLQDWVTADIAGFIFGLNWQLPAMETFVKNVVKNYGSKYDNFYVTGHSLGGYLALMAGAQLVERGVKDKVKGVVTFNGLGLSPSSGFLDIDDNIKLGLIRSKVKNYKVIGDMVSAIGYTPGDDITISMATSLGKWSIGNAHSLASFIERFSNDLRKPSYSCIHHGLNDEK